MSPHGQVAPRPDRASAGAAGLAGWPLILSLAAMQLAAFSDRFVITIVATPLKQALALSDTEVGLLQGSAFALCHAAALPWIGIVADRGHRRTLLIGSLLLWSGATLFCGLAGSFAALVVARMALGLGQSGFAPAALSLLAVRVERGRFGRAVSLLTAGGTLGRSLALLGGGLALGWLTARGGVELPGLGVLEPWRALFVLAVLPNVVLLALALRIVEPPRAPRRAGAARPRALAWMMRRRAAYLPHAGAAAAAVLMGQTLIAWAPTYYVRLFGLSPAESGLRLGLVVLVAAPLGHVVGGWVLDRSRRRGVRNAPARMLGLGLGLALPATAVMCLGSSFAVSLVGFGTLAMILGFTSPPGLAGIQILTPVALRGRVSGVFLAGVTLVGFGLGPVLIGLLNDRVFGAQGIASAVLVLFAAVGLLGIACAWAAAAPRRARS